LSLADSNGWDLTWLADEGVSGGVPPELRKCCFYDARQGLATVDRPHGARARGGAVSFAPALESVPFWT
jgi:hypothetical protein